MRNNQCIIWAVNMDFITCQKCNSDKMVNIIHESDENIQFAHKNKYCEKSRIPKILRDLGESSNLDFYLCFSCGTIAGKFPKPLFFLDEQSSDEESISCTKCKSTHINPFTSTCYDCGTRYEVVEIRCTNCKAIDTYVDSSRICKCCGTLL